jgi:hypothetical protein
VARFGWSPDVVCSELEEGAVVLNMQTRLYYSLNATALEIFRLLAGGADEVALAREVESRFEVGEEQARAALSGFLAQLVAEGLVTDTGVAGGGPLPEPEKRGGGRRPFAPPSLLRHDEPLHEVSTAPFDPQLPLAE